MKVLISADMEGTCGVVDWVQVTPPWDSPATAAPSEYETARRQMTAEVGAACEARVQTRVSPYRVRQRLSQRRHCKLDISEQAFYTL